MTAWEGRVSRLLERLRLDRIRNKLLVFSILATLIPSLTTAWTLYVQNERSLAEKIAGELRSISAQTAREMDLWVKERLYELRVFASSYEVTENVAQLAEAGGVRAHARLTGYLTSVRERFADYQELLVVTPQGQTLATTAAAATPVGLPADWAKTVRRENAVVGEPSWDSVSGRAAVVFAVPIYQTGGRFLGALTAKLDLEAAHNVLRRFAAGAWGRVYLVTDDGRPIAAATSLAAEARHRRIDASVTRRLLENESTPVEFVGLEGDHVVATAKRVPQLNWAVVADVPKREAYRQVVHLRNVTVLAMTALLVGVGGLAYLLGLFITRPLDRLTAGAARVARGDLAVDLPLMGGGELRYVTEVFNDMVARLREGRRELERLSVTDDLTSLFNRRYLMDALANEVRRSRRLNHPFAVLMFDVDHFKKYNDAHGHLAGDAALARVATVLRETARDVDCAVRYGGEEFVLILPETELEGAIATAHRVQSRLASDTVIGNTLTFSVGVAQFPDDGDAPEALLAGADAALYQAKREGRNRVLRAPR